MDKEQVILQRLEQLRQEQLKALKELKKVEKAKRKTRRRTIHGLPVKHGENKGKKDLSSVTESTKHITRGERSVLSKPENKEGRTTQGDHEPVKTHQNGAQPHGNLSTTSPTALHDSPLPPGTGNREVTPHTAEAVTLQQGQAWSTPQFDGDYSPKMASTVPRMGKLASIEKYRTSTTSKKGGIFVTPKSTKVPFKKCSDRSSRNKCTSESLVSSAGNVLKREDLMITNEKRVPQETLLGKATLKTPDDQKKNPSFSRTTRANTKQDKRVEKRSGKMPPENVSPKPTKDTVTLESSNGETLKFPKPGEHVVGALSQQANFVLPDKEFAPLKLEKVKQTRRNLSHVTDKQLESGYRGQNLNELKIDQGSSENCGARSSIDDPQPKQSSRHTLKNHSEAKPSNTERESQSNNEDMKEPNVNSTGTPNTTLHNEEDHSQTKFHSKELDLDCGDASSSEKSDRNSQTQPSRLRILRSNSQSKRNKERNIKSENCNSSRNDSQSSRARRESLRNTASKATTINTELRCNEVNNIFKPSQNREQTLTDAKQSKTGNDSECSIGNPSESFDRKSILKPSQTPNQSLGTDPNTKAKSTEYISQSSSENSRENSQSILSGYGIQTRKQSLTNNPKSQLKNTESKIECSLDQGILLPEGTEKRTTDGGDGHGSRGDGIDDSKVTSTGNVANSTDIFPNTMSHQAEAQCLPNVEKEHQVQSSNGGNKDEIDFPTSQEYLFPVQPFNGFSQCLFSENFDSEMESQEFPLFCPETCPDIDNKIGIQDVGSLSGEQVVRGVERSGERQACVNGVIITGGVGDNGSGGIKDDGNCGSGQPNDAAGYSDWGALCNVDDGILEKSGGIVGEHTDDNPNVGGGVNDNGDDCDSVMDNGITFAGKEITKAVHDVFPNQKVDQTAVAECCPNNQKLKSEETSNLKLDGNSGQRSVKEDKPSTCNFDEHIFGERNKISGVCLEHINILSPSCNKVCAIKYHDINIGESKVQLIAVCLPKLLVLWRFVSPTTWVVVHQWKLQEEEIFSDLEITSVDSCVVICSGGKFSKSLGRVYCVLDRGDLSFDLFEEVSFSDVSVSVGEFQALCLLPNTNNTENLYVVLASAGEEKVLLTKWTIDLLCFCSGDSTEFMDISGSSLSSLVPVHGSNSLLLSCVDFDFYLWNSRSCELLCKIPFYDTFCKPVCLSSETRMGMIFLVLLYKEEKRVQLVSVNPLNRRVACLKTLNMDQEIQEPSDEILYCTKSGSYIITSFTRGQLLLWDISIDKPKLLNPLPDDICCISLHDKQSLIAFGTKSGTVQVITCQD